MSEGVPSYAFQAGFVDYRKLFPDQQVMWTIVGTIFLGVTVISYLPQSFEIIKTRTSYGLSGFAIFFESFCLWLLAYNVICLKSSDFAGIFQYQTLQSFARMLTFLNLFCQWLFFLPVVFLLIIFQDKANRKDIDSHKQRKGALIARIFVIVACSLFIGMFVVWMMFGFSSGFACKAINIIGSGCGLIAAGMEFVQFVPQYITTIKLKDPGSLSLSMIYIQVPTNVANGLFMWLGQNDSPTTFLSALLDASLQSGLLVVCWYFKWKKSRQGGEKTDFSAVSMTLLESIEPVPISKNDYKMDF